MGVRPAGVCIAGRALPVVLPRLRLGVTLRCVAHVASDLLCRPWRRSPLPGLSVFNTQPHTATCVYLSFVVPGLALVAAVGLARGAWDGWARLSGRARLTLSVWTGAALALRLGLPPGGWGDQRATLTDALLGWGQLHSFGVYGRGLEASLAPVLALLGPDPRWLERLGLVSGVLSVPALVALARALGAPWVSTWAAAALLAVAPLHVRFSATVNRYTPLVLLWLAGAALVAWRLRGDPPPGRRSRLLGAGAAVALAVQCRPDAAWLPAGLAGLVWLGHRGHLRAAPAAAPRTPRRVPRDLWALAALVAALLVLPLADLGQRVWAEAAWARFTDDAGQGPALRGLLSPDHNLLLCARYTPVAWAVLAGVGVVSGLRQASRRGVTLWVLAWALLATAIPGTSDIRDDLLSARYHLLALPAWLLLAGQGLGGLSDILSAHWAGRERRHRGVGQGPPTAANPWIAAGLIVATAGLAAFPLPWVTRTTVQDREVAFARRALATLPDGCLVVAFQPRVQDMGIRPGPQLSLAAGRRHRWVERWRPQGEHAAESCAAWYRGSSCSGVGTFAGFDAERDDVCLGVAAQAGPALAQAELGHDTAGSHRLRAGPVHVALHWLRRPLTH